MIYINTTGKQNQVWLPKPYDIVIDDCPECPSVEDAWGSGYTSGFSDGVESVICDDCTDYFNSGYTSGKTDGYGEGYEDGLRACSGDTGTTCNLQEKAFYLNPGFTPTTITPDDGYDGLESVYVADNGYGEERYDAGYEAGLAACSGGCTPEQLAAAYNSGITYQKSLLSSSSFTQNGTYTRANGWSSVTIAVEQTGYTQEDLNRAYQSGYTAGMQDCVGPATSVTLNVASAITGSGQATVTIDPTCAATDYTFTSSNNNLATIDSAGTITAAGNGNVTFCVTENISQIQDCKTVAVSIAPPANTNVLNFVYETSASNQTIRLFNGLAQDNNNYFYNFYSAITMMVIDDVVVQKSPSNIRISNPRSADYYFYKFSTAGRHTVTYYMSKSFTGTSNPAVVLDALIFADGLGECPLVEANIGSGYQHIGQGVFQDATRLTAVTLPNTITEIGPFSFEYSGIKSITIPNSVTALTYDMNEGLFNSCTSLTSATIGTGLSSLLIYMFKNCSALKTVTMNRTTPPTMSALVFSGCSALQHIYVPSASVNAYKQASGWSDYASIISAKP